jgi:hypothetical protein
VTAKVRRNQAPIADVTLLLRINYTPEQQIPMTASGDAGGCLVNIECLHARSYVFFINPFAEMAV